MCRLATSPYDLTHLGTLANGNQHSFKPRNVHIPYKCDEVLINIHFSMQWSVSQTLYHCLSDLTD